MRNKLTSELAVCGLNAVKALGEYHPQNINRLFLREDRLPVFTGICKQLAARKRPYKICGDEELERICKSSHHQGVIAMMIEPAVPDVSREDIVQWDSQGWTGLVLHSVGNDHNLGAIVRAAAFFDTRIVVLNEGDDAAMLSTSAYRVAEGGMEQVSFRSVQNTAAFLRRVSRILVTIGTDSRARQRISDIAGIVQNAAAGKGRRPGAVLVLGNEETGLPPDVKSACSCLVRIPGTGTPESLNVSQAAALFLRELYEK
ncbi:MAG: RNA methyltransferase [Treponema sp.]|jgi:TrmH RNA methyltransferase|nr:RNA methyltransferase [Treponema sp.]